MDLLALIVMFWVFLAWMNELFKPPRPKSEDEKLGKAFKELADYLKPDCDS